jgi:hypothetical protein
MRKHNALCALPNGISQPPDNPWLAALRIDYSERAGLFEPDWVETQLAHAEQNKVRRAYNAALYLKHRRMILQWWADFVDRQAAGLRVVA